MLASRRILPDVFTITFESLDRPFQYRPGQFLHLTLDPYDPTKSWPESRCFSIQSPPSQGARALDISFATKGAYTQRMANELTVGRVVPTAILRGPPSPARVGAAKPSHLRPAAWISSARAAGM